MAHRVAQSSAAQPAPHGVNIGSEMHKLANITCQVVCAAVTARARKEARRAQASAEAAAAALSSDPSGESVRLCSAIGRRTPSPSNIGGMLSLLALLGHSCLHMGHTATLEYLSSPQGLVTMCTLRLVASASRAWLEGPNEAHVAALGYNGLPGAVMECLLTAAAVSEAATKAHSDDAVSQAVVSELQEQFHTVGQVLSSFGHPSACNNPACTTFRGPSDSSLVVGSNSKCSSCRMARYCSKSCQRAAWKQHKPVCRALAAGCGGWPAPLCCELH